MKTLISFLSEPVAVALGWTLLHALWQGFALVLPAALLIHFFRHKSSQLRYIIGVGALLAQCLVSAVTFSQRYQALLQTARVSAKTVVLSVVTMPVSWPVLAGHPLPWYVQTQRFLEGHLTEVVVCWLLGVFIFLVRLAGGWLYVQRLKTTAVQPADAFWQASLARLSTRLALRQPVRMLESVQVLVPMVVGALKPVILLPVGLAAGLSMREAEAILAHELAHIKRFDYAVNLLQSVMEVLFFFHPALWWLSARVREERENCCDDLAVLACGDARSLARALARVEEFSQVPALAMALASQKNVLLNRVRRMLGVSARPVVSNTHLLVLTLATVLLATVSIYAMQERQPRPRSTKAPSPATRRQQLSNGTEFGITATRTVDYIVWKGQRLPAKRVASLQRQLDRVMTGQLSLDNVPQADRDILLTIIETGQVGDGGAGSSNAIDSVGLMQALASVNVDSMLASIKVDSLLGMMGSAARSGYLRVAGEAMASVGNQSFVQHDSLALIRAHNARKTDSLSRLIAVQQGKADALRMQMEKLRFPIEELTRKQEVLQWRRDKLMEQRNVLIEKHQRLLDNAYVAKQKLSQSEVEKQLAALELDIKKQETGIEEWNNQTETLKAREEEVKKPMDNLQQASEQIEKEVSRLAEAIEKQEASSRWGSLHEVAGPDGVATYYSTLEEPERPEIPDVPAMLLNGSARPLKAPRPPKYPKLTAIPGVVAVPRVAARPARAAIPAKPVIPAKAPKPAVAPKN